jgi:hypothetical protein
VLHSKCAIQDVFADSRFLKQEALQVRQLAVCLNVVTLLHAGVCNFVVKPGVLQVE